MKKPRRDGPGERAIERRTRRERASGPGQAGTFTGHEHSTGSTYQAIRRNKRSR